MDALRPQGQRAGRADDGVTEARAHTADAGDGHALFEDADVRGEDGDAGVVRAERVAPPTGVGGERRGGGALAGGTETLRGHLQALHQEAVGQVPDGARRVGAHAAAVPHVDGRPLLLGRLAGAAGARVHAHLREHAPARPEHHGAPQRRLLRPARDAGKLPKYSLLVYTGPIDSYFAQQGMPRLEYRSLRFEEEFVPEPEGGFFQEAMVVNYPSPDVPFTRIVEYKHVAQPAARPSSAAR